MMKLEHKAHPVVAQAGEFATAKPINALAFEPDLSGIGPVEGTQDVEQGTLARPRLADQCHEFSGLQGKIHTAQHGQLAVLLPDVSRFKHKIWHDSVKLAKFVGYTGGVLSVVCLRLSVMSTPLSPRRAALLRRAARSRFFRYLFAAGAGFGSQSVLMVVLYHAVFEKSSYEACFAFSFLLGTVVNFSISRAFVFRESKLRARTQGSRFLVVALVGFVANLFLSKALLGVFRQVLKSDAEWVTWGAVFMSAAVIAFFSYFSHKLFTFQAPARTKPKSLDTVQELPAANG
jgi:putative flippase GtrA